MTQGESRDLWVLGGVGAVVIMGLLVLGVFGPGVTNLLFMFAAFGVVVLLLGWVTAVPTLLFIGARDLLRSMSKDAEVDSPMRHAGLLDLGFALALAGVPFVAARVAEMSTGWNDPDGDGMLGGFVNGAYDWFDFVFPSAVLWGIGLAVTLTVLRSALKRRWQRGIPKSA
jgi:hypothetical protein